MWSIKDGYYNRFPNDLSLTLCSWKHTSLLSDPPRIKLRSRHLVVPITYSQVMSSFHQLRVSQNRIAKQYVDMSDRSMSFTFLLSRSTWEETNIERSDDPVESAVSNHNMRWSVQRVTFEIALHSTLNYPDWQDDSTWTSWCDFDIRGSRFSHDRAEERDFEDPTA